VLTHIALATLTGVGCAAGTFVGFYVAAKRDPDMTVGGAYNAAAMMLSPVAFIAGVLVYSVIVSVW
jgi:hydroxyethylthiazole kinase-like sugar kinase family protein